MHPVSEEFRSIMFKLELLVIFFSYVVLRQLSQFTETLDGHLVNIDVELINEIR